MSEVGKRGSSRRKGDEFQDLVALKFALEYFIAQKPFNMFLEYEQSGNLDDVVIFDGNDILAHQVKYAVHGLDVYEADDFIDKNSPVYIKKFTDSWNAVRQRYPEYNLKVRLCSNRSLNAELVNCVDSDGTFKDTFIENRMRGEAKNLRNALQKACGLNEDQFRAFLQDFQFVVRQPNIIELEQYIRTVLLDKELGLSDDTIFFDLMDAIKNYAVYYREAITIKTIDVLLERLQSKLLIPQVFPVNQSHYIEQRSLSQQLDLALARMNGEYIVVTGLPGSGKSTSLTAYFDSLDTSEYEVLSYYCFVNIHDNAQRMRAQADSLRANLLSEMQRRYPDILRRRYDYSERNFYTCLAEVAKYFTEQDRRFVIFLDGLDHAERLESELRETVISALPSDVPEGITIVVGTQELQKWPHFIRRARDYPESYIQMPLFSFNETENYLVNKRGLTELSRSDIVEIYRKSEGLPLYLNYVAELLVTSDSMSDTVSSLSPALGGDIYNYYALLWEEFERVGMANAKHLCGVMACLRFSSHRDELYRITNLARPAFEDAYKSAIHLLRNTDGRLAVFHNSFREFVTNQLTEDWIEEIRKCIAVFLKDIKHTPRWFSHVFKYCYEIGEFTYILDEVDADFIDCALMYCRPTEEIMDALCWAIESAYQLQDIVQISRLGTLKFRTGDRLENNLNRSLLAESLLAQGREQEVMSFAYSSEADRWMVDRQTSLAVMYRFAETNRMELGRKLFEVFTNEFHGIQSTTSDEMKTEVIGIARCLAIFSPRHARAIRWLSQFKFEPNLLEPKNPYAPGYAPHLAAYIDTLVQFDLTVKLESIKRVRTLFPNRLVRYYIIQALARYNRIDELKGEIVEYCDFVDPSGNVELAFYAAKAQMPSDVVARITGTVKVPKLENLDRISPGDPILRQYLYTFIAIAYEGQEQAFQSLVTTFGESDTLWNAVVRHLLKAGLSIARSLDTPDYDWFTVACESIDVLVSARQGAGERIVEAIDLIRDMLPISIGLMTEQVSLLLPHRLSEWISVLSDLRNSIIWTTHYGINESLQDYTFELNLWEKLSRIHRVPRELPLILRDCATTYSRSTLLKGGSRSDHFIQLSAIMARSGMRDDSDRWLRYGIRASLIYGYHKDVTLFHLIDVLKLVNERFPESAIEYCARVLPLIDWMPYLTNGKETKWLHNTAFKAVLQADRSTAFSVLQHYVKSIARWKMQDCLEEYIITADEGDLDFLWCLTEIFANHFSEDGRHSHQMMDVRKHIVEMAVVSGSVQTHAYFEERFKRFILTEISPRHWPGHLKKEHGYLSQSEEMNDYNTKKDEVQKSDIFLLDGANITKQDLQERCLKSFTEFRATIQKVKEQNEYFYDRDLIDTSLSHHIAAAKTHSDMTTIMSYIQTRGRWQDSNIIYSLAQRFVEFGDYDNALICFGMAYATNEGPFSWNRNAKYLSAAAAIDKQRAGKMVLEECYESTKGSAGGYETSAIAATGLYELDEPDLLVQVFLDFLDHCESMFSQLPKDKDYAWLAQYKEPSSDLNRYILDLVVDQLETPEIDLGERLIKAIAELAVNKPTETIPILMTRSLSASGRVLRRLLTIVYCIAAHEPGLLVSHQESLVKLLDRKDFLCRQAILRILGMINEHTPLNAIVSSFVKEIERGYSSAVYHSTYRLPASPSPEFNKFIQRHTLNFFPQQIELMEKILQISPGGLITAIEQQLKARNWSMEEERVRIKDDWDGHVHPQGWPVVWITTEFQELVMVLLLEILDEAAIKLKLNNQHMDRLWQTIQLADPVYVFHGVSARPADIKPITVHDKESWLNVPDTVEPLQIAESRELENEWITVYESRSIAMEEIHNVPYKQSLSIQAFLIPQKVYGRTEGVEELDFWTERILPGSGMSVTMKQTEAELTARRQKIMYPNDETLPLIAIHHNQQTFLGYSSVCSLASFIIKDFNLTFEGLNLVQSGKIIAHFESWQEGYQDEAYSREKLAYGIRFRVHRDLLAKICSRYRKVLCSSIEEEREFYQSIYKPIPDERNVSRRYILFHL